MDLYDLPENIIYKIFKTYFSLNILDKLHCSDCVDHGFPCMYCARYKYNGKKGPGYNNDKRTLSINIHEVSDDIEFNMLKWLLANECEEVITIIDSS